MSVKKELLGATGLKGENGEDPQVFFARVAKAASKLPEDAWDSLSTEAQDWVNAAGEEINTAKKEERASKVAGFPKADVPAAKPTPVAEPEEEEAAEDAEDSEDEVEEIEEPEAEASDEDETEDEQEAEDAEEESDDEPAPKKETEKVKKDKTEKPTKVAKPVKEPKEPKADAKPKKARSGVSGYIRLMILKNQAIKEKAAFEKAKAKFPDLNENTLRGIYQSASGFLRAATAAGYKIVKNDE